MQIPDELMAWLGPAADEMTGEQIQRLSAEYELIAAYYPDPDEMGERDAALSAVVQYLLGDTTPQDAARELADARRRERQAYAAALWAGVMAVRDDTPKAAAARLAGVDRMSLLEALGERARRRRVGEKS